MKLAIAITLLALTATALELKTAPAPDQDEAQLLAFFDALETAKENDAEVVDDLEVQGMGKWAAVVNNGYMVTYRNKA